jgi:hypothetical protein
MDELADTCSESLLCLSVIEHTRLVKLQLLVEPLDQEVLREYQAVVIQELHESWRLELLVNVDPDEVQDDSLEQALLSDLSVNLDQVDEQLLVLGPQLEDVLPKIRGQQAAHEDKVFVVV